MDKVQAIKTAILDVDEHGYQLQETNSIDKKKFIKDTRQWLKTAYKGVVFSEVDIYEEVTQYLGR